MRGNVRMLHREMPAYFMQKRATFDAIGARTTREQEFWEMAGLLAFLFLVVASVLVLVFA